ncbi:hypothetical protein [Legionella saoudiensis]|uniref:hypothetical protein n=1 Tax=Legionella saoudiensis TaxID=1750561 RepID=UPI0007300CED|nr:hypothetical protein [Legionella saoudiensis]
MKKINGGYESLFEYLVKKDFPFARFIDARLYPVENATLRYISTAPYTRRYNETPREYWTDQFIGAMQPIASMINDIQYTFKPYKSSHEFLMDMAQPLRGLKNVLRGLANLVATPLFFLGNTVRYAFNSGSWSNFSNNMKLNLGRSSSWLIDGLSSIVRGSTQVIASPLTWALRMPLRGIITAIKGTPDITENEEIQHLVDLGHQAIAEDSSYTMDCIRHRLHEEYQKSVSRGQHSEITPEQEEKAFNSMHFKYGKSWIYPMPAKKESITYLSLFRKEAITSLEEQLPLQETNSL